jgi:signal peptidase I
VLVAKQARKRVRRRTCGVVAGDYLPVLGRLDRETVGAEGPNGDDAPRSLKRQERSAFVRLPGRRLAIAHVQMVTHAHGAASRGCVKPATLQIRSSEGRGGGSPADASRSPASGRVQQIVRCTVAIAVVLASWIAAGCGGKAETTRVTSTPVNMRLLPTTYRVAGGSMEPTLGIGAIVRAETSYTPRVGDIVVFHPPKDAAVEICGRASHAVKPGGAACVAPEREHAHIEFIQRIVAGPGDVISIVEGHVIRNGKREPDSYIRQREPDSNTQPCAGIPECSFPTPIKIPADHWFMMGDNRSESDDSRFWGPVPTSWILGRARSCAEPSVPCSYLERRRSSVKPS